MTEKEKRELSSALASLAVDAITVGIKSALDYVTEKKKARKKKKKKSKETL